MAALSFATAHQQQPLQSADAGTKDSLSVLLNPRSSSGGIFTNTIRKDAFLQTQEEFSVAGLLKKFFPVQPIQLSDEGHLSFAAVPGIPVTGTALLFHDLLFFDPAVSLYSLSWISLEAIESVSLYLGTPAVLATAHSSGAALSLRSFTYDIRYPYTRIWFTQRASDFTGSDGTFSMNLTPTLNIFAGFRRINRPDVFPNSFVDLWNVRAGVTWKRSDAHVLRIIDLFTNDHQGINGGIRSIDQATLLTPALADVLLPSVRQRVYRHDILLESDWRISPYLHLRSRGGISLAEWNLYQSAGNRWFPDDTNERNRWRTTSLSFQNQLTAQLHPFELMVQSDIAHYSSESNPYIARSNTSEIGIMGKIRYHSQNSQLEAGTRFTFLNQRWFWNAGLRAFLQWTPQLSTVLDLCTYTALPNFTVEGTEHYRNWLGIIGTEYKEQFRNISLAALYHILHLPSFWILTADSLIKGSSSSGSTNHLLALFGTFRFNFPFLSITAIMGQSWRIRGEQPAGIFDGAFLQLLLKHQRIFFKHPITITLSTRLQSHPFSYRFFPQGWIWAYDSVQEHLWDGLSLYASIEFSKAVVLIGINNLFDRSFFSIPIYPYRGRALQISIRWAIIDAG